MRARIGCHRATRKACKRMQEDNESVVVVWLEFGGPQLCVVRLEGARLAQTHSNGGQKQRPEHQATTTHTTQARHGPPRQQLW